MHNSIGVNIFQSFIRLLLITPRTRANKPKLNFSSFQAQFIYWVSQKSQNPQKTNRSSGMQAALQSYSRFLFHSGSIV
jgi:hypothetical protein